jgi:hypothetical protein
MHSVTPQFANVPRILVNIASPHCFIIPRLSKIVFNVSHPARHASLQQIVRRAKICFFIIMVNAFNVLNIAKAV